MNITLCDIHPDLVREWEKAFAGVPEVTVKCGDILKVQAQALVSPANSFGFMDGGIDWVYTKHFGVQLQDRLQDRIRHLPARELPVGHALTVTTGHSWPSILISAPTMRTPQHVGDTINAYLAFKAALGVASSEGLYSLVCPGLGTGVGGVLFSDCAKQMRAAFDHWKSGFFPETLSAASTRERALL